MRAITKKSCRPFGAGTLASSRPIFWRYVSGNPLKMLKFIKSKFLLNGTIYQDQNLGSLEYFRESKDWKGDFKGMDFYLIKEKCKRSPSNELLEYAYQTLMRIPQIKDQLNSEKSKLLQRHPLERDDLSHLDFSQLTFSRLDNDIFKTSSVLEPEYNERVWVMQFLNDDTIELIDMNNFYNQQER